MSAQIEKVNLGLGDLDMRQEYKRKRLCNKITKDIEQQKLHDEITGIWNDQQFKLDAMSTGLVDNAKPVVDDIQKLINKMSIQKWKKY